MSSVLIELNIDFVNRIKKYFKSKASIFPLKNLPCPNSRQVALFHGLSPPNKALFCTFFLLPKKFLKKEKTDNFLNFSEKSRDTMKKKFFRRLL